MNAPSPLTGSREVVNVRSPLQRHFRKAVRLIKNAGVKFQRGCRNKKSPERLTIPGFEATQYSKENGLEFPDEIDRDPLVHEAFFIVGQRDFISGTDIDSVRDA